MKGEIIMKSLVIGANGQIGKHLITQMKNHPALQAKAMIRDEKQAEFFHNAGAEPDIPDLHAYIDKIDEVGVGCDAVGFVDGYGTHTFKNTPNLVDIDGAVKSI